MVFLKSAYNLAECQRRMPRFNTVTFADITDNPHPMQNLVKVRATVLYSTKAIKKYRTVVPAKNKLPSSNREITTFHRFLVFGIPGSVNTMVLFSKNASQTKDLLRFSSEFRPGDDVWILLPQVQSYLSPQTPEITTNEPFVPCEPAEWPMYVEIQPPDDVEVDNYVHFDFITQSLSVNAGVQDNMCMGSLCDGQNENASCACTNPGNQRRWLVALTVMCDEIQSNTRCGVSLTSERTSRVFVHGDALSWPLANHWNDALDLHTSVRL